MIEKLSEDAGILAELQTQEGFTRFLYIDDYTPIIRMPKYARITSVFEDVEVEPSLPETMDFYIKRFDPVSKLAFYKER